MAFDSIAEEQIHRVYMEKVKPLLNLHWSQNLRTVKSLLYYQIQMDNILEKDWIAFVGEELSVIYLFIV